MTQAIDAELGLPASAGLATSTSMAKVACGLAKPHGVLLVRPGEEERTLAPLPVRKLPGIGPVSETKLAEHGILTLGDVVRAPDSVLRPVFGSGTNGIRQDARGLGSAAIGRERPAFREHDPHGGHVGSISNERTFRETSKVETESLLCGLAERVCSRARSRGVRAGCVTLRLRYTDFETITRACGRSVCDSSVSRSRSYVSRPRSSSCRRSPGPSVAGAPSMPSARSSATTRCTSPPPSSESGRGDRAAGRLRSRDAP